MGHGSQKLDLLCILNRLFVVLINLFYQLDFLFQLTEKGIFMRVLFYSFLLVLFFIHCENGIGLKVDVPSRSTSKWLFKVGSVVGYLSVIVQRQFLLHICILVGVMFHFLQGKILYFWVFQL